MANPSTQPPCNARTTDIIFARDFVQSSYTLLEIPKSLEAYISGNGEGPLSFQVRGLEKDTAVLCTPTQTFSLQRAHTSNMLLPIAPIISQRRQGYGTADMEIDTDPYQIYEDESDDSPYEKQVVLDILDSVLDLIPISPRLDRLAELLGQCPFEGWARESEQKGRLYSWTQLQSIIQASDKEILQWLKERHACMIEGHWRLFKRRFMFDILQEILMTMNVLEMSAEAIDGNTLCKMIEEEAPERESGIESWMVEHCLESFSDDEQVLKPGYYHLSAKKLRTYMGVHLLSTIERGNRWKLEEFMYTWEKSLHGHFQADLADLAGECVVEADRLRERNQVQRFVRYFSKSHLPNDPATRFMALFEIKNKWEGQEIRPFLRDLVLDEKKLDILLLKHARSVKQPGGGVVYSSRVIK
ncbi:sister chromatid cohesion protein Dcc1 [Dissophora ornata]|nr:sister chromatid cohesion protein Dcc1 [Dissophora ornata]